MATAALPQDATPTAIVGPAEVVDGDTIKIDGARIRLFGIDAPEIQEWPWGPRARSALEDLVLGRIVTCRQRDTDRYDRPVATCATAETPDLAEELIGAGHAIAYRRFTAGTELHGPYLAAEAAAQSAGLGPSAPEAGPSARWVDTPGGGATIGVFGGLVAIVIGALFNAWLVRRRDAQVREESARALAAELAAEFIGAGRLFHQNKELLESLADKTESGQSVSLAQLYRPDFEVLRANFGSLGILGTRPAVDVITEYRRSVLLWQMLVGRERDAHAVKRWASVAPETSIRLTQLGFWLAERAGIDPMTLLEDPYNDAAADHGDRQSGNGNSSE